MPQGASSGKRSLKGIVASGFQGASATQKVRASEWSGELAWNRAHHSGSSGTTVSQKSYDPQWPYIAYVTEDDLPGGPRYAKCLLCKKWCQDETAHMGTQEAPSGSKEHQKNLRNCWPGHPWYEEHVVQVRLRWHPETAAAAAAAAAGSGTCENDQYIPAWPYIAYVTEDGTPNGPRFPKCLLCNKWCQDEASHCGTQALPAGSTEHRKNLRNYGPGDPWYERMLQEQRIWHPASSAAQAQAAEAQEGTFTQVGSGGMQRPVDTAARTRAIEAQEGTAAQVEPGGMRSPFDLPWWLEIREGEQYCKACGKWATPEHLTNDKHLRRVATGDQCDESASTDPWIEPRDGDGYCLACRKWATAEHRSSANHLWRVQQWGQQDIVVTDPWIQKRDGELFCLACGKWATPDHLVNAKHLWRAQAWAALGRAAGDPGDIVAAMIKETPLRRSRRGAATDGDVFVLESLDAGIAPAAVCREDFRSWPLLPRANDVLLVSAAPTEDAAAPRARPRLREACPLSVAEQATFAKRLESWCEKSFSETCTTMVAEYYPYVLYALQNAESPDAVAPLLRVLKRTAQEAVIDASEGQAGSAIRVFLLDAVRSAMIGAAAPQLLASGKVDVALCKELAGLLVQFIPNGLSRVKLLLQASCEQLLKQVTQESIPEILDNEEFPRHWVTSSTSLAKQKHSWTAVPLEEGGDVFNALKQALVTDPSNLGSECPVVQRGSYSGLGLKRAWRIENPRLLESYLREKRCLRMQRYELELHALPKASFRQPLLMMPQIDIRQEILAAFEELPKQPDEIAQDVNEVRLLAGAKPEDILLLSREGLNPNANGGKFGKGSHLAEDAGKCDQNAICDETGKNKELKDLHSKLFTKAVKHPGNIYYIFVCRVVLGYFVRTCTGDADARTIDGGEAVYASGDLRELADIPGTMPPVPYQSLVMEVGDQLRRYREFVQFESRRIYPEYLLAYHRV